MRDIRNLWLVICMDREQIYSSIIDTLEKEQKKTLNEKIVLYINGDIIARGPYSILMLLDVMDRVKGKKEIFY